MNLKEIVEKTTQFFKDKKIESARLDSEMLISTALGLRRIDLYIKFEQPLREDELEKCRVLVRRRAQGEPVAYILGQKDFYNLSFCVDSNVLIPRPETETLVEMAIDWLNQNKISNPKVLDMGAGSGCIGLTIAKNIPQAEVTLVEASVGAKSVLEKNTELLGLTGSVAIELCRVQDFQFDKTKFDLILANPPYIGNSDIAVEENVQKFEPHSALFAENNGLSEIYAWSTRAISALNSPGLMIFEIGMSQGGEVKKHFETLGDFDTVEIRKDLSGLDRFVVGEKGELNG